MDNRREPLRPALALYTPRGIADHVEAGRRDVARLVLINNTKKNGGCRHATRTDTGLCRWYVLLGGRDQALAGGPRGAVSLRVWQLTSSHSKMISIYTVLRGNKICATRTWAYIRQHFNMGRY